MKTKGQVGYEAYAEHTGGKTFDGRDMPTWEQVCASGTKVAGAWEAAAAAILAAPSQPVEQQPTVGRIVHYVLFRGEDRTPLVRPAIIVHIWAQAPQQEHDGTVQLQVFTDGSNDGPGCESGVKWVTSVKHDEETKATGTWHLPPRV
jgi:hypothetical protein